MSLRSLRTFLLTLTLPFIAACASAPAQPASAVASAPTFPTHALVGYWQNFTNAAPAQKLTDVSSNFNVVAAAFATPDGNTDGGFTFSIDSGLASALGGYTLTSFNADVKTLHQQSRIVLLSIGGASQSFALTSDAMATNFANSAYSVMQANGFDGVDIDLEGVITYANLPYLEEALRNLSKLAGSSLIVTLAPQATDMTPEQPTVNAYLQLTKDLGPIVTMVNTQYYNSGTQKGLDGKVYTDGTVDFITALADDVLQTVPASQVGLGFTAYPSTKGYVTPQNALAATTCLTAGTGCGAYIPSKKYPNLRGNMIWSAAWDQSQSNALSTALKP